MINSTNVSQITDQFQMKANYLYVFDFENEFIQSDARKWMVKNWPLPIYCSVIYVIIIFGGKFWMQNRTKYDLRRPLALWSSALAIFSIIGASRTVTRLFYDLHQDGLYGSVCFAKNAEHDPVYNLWIWLFTISKVPELCDTIFIILRKQPLIFLHWYHHISVLIFSWQSYTGYESTARWFSAMNFCVHAVMYSYYALRAMGYKLPRIVSIMITLMQLIQMIVGCMVTWWAYNYIQSNPGGCETSFCSITISIIIYISYFILFARFFYAAYLSPRKRKQTSMKPNNIYQTHNQISNADTLCNVYKIKQQ